MTAILLALVLAAQPRPACYGDGHNEHRSKAAVRHFRRTHPCPGGRDRGSVQRCRGYEVDHVCPLACCGQDVPGNMQWLTARENREKGDDCSSCLGATQ